MPTPTEIFQEIDTRLRAAPERTAGMDAAYAFDLSGDGGGPFHIVIRDGAGEAGPGDPLNPGVRVAATAQDFVDLVTGRLDGIAAFMNGRLTVTGDMSLAMRLQEILRT